MRASGNRVAHATTRNNFFLFLIRLINSLIRTGKTNNTMLNCNGNTLKNSNLRWLSLSKPRQ